MLNNEVVVQVVWPEPSTNPHGLDEVIELARDLKRARESVASLEPQWASFFSNGNTAEKSVAKLNLKPRIVQYLEERSELAFKVSTVAKALDANKNSVGPYLGELAKEGKIEKRERGLYGALRAVAPYQILYGSRRGGKSERIRQELRLLTHGKSAATQTDRPIPED